ncbi:MAG: hypothetical protein ACXABF_05745 [Candidatus Thorarchaeota archaeon]
MILRAYILKSNGDPLYSTSYSKSDSDDIETIPPHVRACVILFRSRDSTQHGQMYTLEQEDNMWVYLFSETLAVVLLTSLDEDTTHLQKRMLSLSEALAENYGAVITSWSGSMASIEGLDDLVKSYVTFDLSLPSKRLMSKIEKLINIALEDKNVAYAGVFDASGEMLRGNVPESHIEKIHSEIARGVIKPVVDIVPTAMSIRGYDVQMFKVQSLTVAVAAYRESSKLDAVKVAGEIAQSLEDSMK